MSEMLEFPALLVIILLLYINFTILSLVFLAFLIALVFVLITQKTQPIAKPRGINLMEVPRPQVKSTIGQSTQKIKMD